MCHILEYFWSTPTFHATMVEFARDLKRFVRFVNMLINDSIYAMNEVTRLAFASKDTTPSSTHAFLATTHLCPT